MTTLSTAPAAASLEDWYATLGVDAPPPFRGVHRLGDTCPGFARYAVVTAAGTILFDGIVTEPVSPERRAQMHLLLDLADPRPAPLTLRLVR